MTKRKIFLAVTTLLILIAIFGVNTCALAAAETRYADAPIVSAYAGNEAIYYTTKEIVAENYTPGRCPLYYGLSDLSNECGAVAGAEIAAFYDKYYPDLVPNWVSYYPSSGKYRIQDSTNVPALIRTMYTLMRTNVDDVGVSRTDFLNGLKTYVNNNGYQVSYQSVKSGNAIDFNQCKSAIDNNKVVVLFALPCTIYDITDANGYDGLIPINITGAHIMVAFGYYKVNYYNNSGLFRTDTYLCLATGRSDIEIAFYRVDATTTQAAYIVNIS